MPPPVSCRARHRTNSPISGGSPADQHNAATSLAENCASYTISLITTRSCRYRILPNSPVESAVSAHKKPQPRGPRQQRDGCQSITLRASRRAHGRGCHTHGGPMRTNMKSTRTFRIGRLLAFVGTLLLVGMPQRAMAENEAQACNPDGQAVAYGDVPGGVRHRGDSRPRYLHLPGLGG